jgi:hypothetical protein
MPWNDSDQTVIAGTGEVYVAAVGTALPASTSATLAAAFNGLGYHSEDGVSINSSVEIEEHRAWQSKHAIRRERGDEEFQVTFELLQWNEINVPLAFGGGTVTDLGGGQFKYVPPSETDGIEERTLIVDLDDGADRLRLIIPRGTVVEGVESQFARGTMSPLPITFKALEPETGGDAWHFLTNRADFATGS